MAEADVVYFGSNWKSARGCKIEYEVAKEYGIDIIEECKQVHNSLILQQEDLFPPIIKIIHI